MDNNTNKSALGPTLGVIIILAVIVVGSLYFWGQRSVKKPAPQTATSSSDIQRLKTQSGSDDISSIEADLKATNFNNLDQGSSSLQ